MLARAREDGEVVVTDNGRPAFRILPIDGTARWAEIMASGVVRPATVDRGSAVAEFRALFSRLAGDSK